MPAVVQDADSGAVLMLGYMNREALAQTLRARTRRVLQPQQAAAVGERRDLGHTLDLVDVRTDCDHDTLLVTARAARPGVPPRHGHLLRRRAVTRRRAARLPAAARSHHRAAHRARTPKAAIPRACSRRARGASRRRSARKASRSRSPRVAETDDKVIAESADLLFHLLVLLKSRGVPLARVVTELESRHAAKYPG